MRIICLADWSLLTPESAWQLPEQQGVKAAVNSSTAWLHKSAHSRIFLCTGIKADCIHKLFRLMVIYRNIQPAAVFRPFRAVYHKRAAASAPGSRTFHSVCCKAVPHRSFGFQFFIAGFFYRFPATNSRQVAASVSAFQLCPQVLSELWVSYILIICRKPLYLLGKAK